MKKKLLFLVLSLIFLPLLINAEESTVKILMFYSTTCGNCKEVLRNDFPQIEEKFGSKVNIKYLGFEEAGMRELCKKLYTQAGITRNIGVPSVFIGDKFFIGAKKIKKDLVTTVETELNKKNYTWPYQTELPAEQLKEVITAKQLMEKIASQMSAVTRNPVMPVSPAGVVTRNSAPNEAALLARKKNEQVLGQRIQYLQTLYDEAEKSTGSAQAELLLKIGSISSQLFKNPTDIYYLRSRAELAQKLHFVSNSQSYMPFFFYDGTAFDEIINKFPEYAKQAYLGKISILEDKANNYLPIKVEVEALKNQINQNEKLRDDPEIKRELEMLDILKTESNN